MIVKLNMYNSLCWFHRGREYMLWARNNILFTIQHIIMKWKCLNYVHSDAFNCSWIILYKSWKFTTQHMLFFALIHRSSCMIQFYMLLSPTPWAHPWRFALFFFLILYGLGLPPNFLIGTIDSYKYLKKGWKEMATCSLLFREMCSDPMVRTRDRSKGWDVMLCGKQLTVEVVVNGKE